jgi:hypothetical protein
MGKKHSIQHKIQVLKIWIEDLKRNKKAPRKRVVELDDE